MESPDVWPISNFDAVAIGFLLLAAITTIVRLYVRINIHRSTNLDDKLAVAATVSDSCELLDASY